MDGISTNEFNNRFDDLHLMLDKQFSHVNTQFGIINKQLGGLMLMNKDVVKELGAVNKKVDKAHDRIDNIEKIQSEFVAERKEKTTIRKKYIRRFIYAIITSIGIGAANWFGNWFVKIKALF